MVKVKTDATMTVDQTFDSLEIVAIRYLPFLSDGLFAFSASAVLKHIRFSSSVQ